MLRLIVLAGVISAVVGTIPPDFKGLFGDDESTEDVGPGVTYIVGGRSADIRDHPYQVSMRIRGQPMCGGSIISSKYILTAAHCTEPVRNMASPITFRVGSTNVNSGGQILQADRVFAHPQYNAGTYDYDVAVVRVVETIRFSDSARAIALPRATTASDSSSFISYIVSGWGRIRENGPPSTTLQMTNVIGVRDTQCNQNYRGRITARMLCAHGTGTDSCQGDSGGPLVDDRKSVQIGVVSWGVGCANPNYPGVYTRLANPNIRNFISESTNNAV